MEEAGPDAQGHAEVRDGGVEVLVDQVSKAFEGGEIEALRGVSLRLQPGDFVAVVGPSGCGKSTLLNLIGALDRADAGTIRVGGETLDELPDAAEYRAATVGFVFQFHHLIATLNARENVQVPMIGRGLSRHERVSKADGLLAACAIAHRATARPETLSGGERQRVAIARALANDPKLLLADEPTGALDSTTGAQIVELLHGLRDERGMTILLVTNDDDVAAAADRTLRIRDGRVEDAAPASPVGAPRSA
jgi:putative ABC transport system ATP-binding protein